MTNASVTHIHWVIASTTSSKLPEIGGTVVSA